MRTVPELSSPGQSAWQVICIAFATPQQCRPLMQSSSPSHTETCPLQGAPMGRHMITGPACSKQHVLTPGTQISPPQMRVASAAASMTSTNSHCPDGGPPQQPDTCE